MVESLRAERPSRQEIAEIAASSSSLKLMVDNLGHTMPHCEESGELARMVESLRAELPSRQEIAEIAASSSSLKLMVENLGHTMPGRSEVGEMAEPAVGNHRQEAVPS